MNDIYKYVMIVLFPLILSNIMHMIVVKINLLKSLNKPLWTNGFGENKTWRGFVFVPIINALILLFFNFIFHLSINNPVLLGFVLGISYLLFELPNSFLKRKLGIKSGEKNTKFKFLFSLLDKMDSAFGVAFMYFLLGFANFQFAVLFFMLNSVAHIAFSYLLVILKIKRSF